MADVMSSMDAVYKKWEKKGTTVNGSCGPPQQNSAEQVVDNGRKAWKSRFKELPPQPERRNRNPRSTGARSQPFKMVSSIYVMPSVGLNFRSILSKLRPN